MCVCVVCVAFFLFPRCRNVYLAICDCDDCDDYKRPDRLKNIHTDIGTHTQFSKNTTILVLTIGLLSPLSLLPNATCTAGRSGLLYTGTGAAGATSFVARRRDPFVRCPGRLPRHARRKSPSSLYLFTCLTYLSGYYGLSFINLQGFNSRRL